MQRVWSFTTRLSNDRFDLADSVVSSAQQFRDFLADLVYIGPLRDYPERQYVFGGSFSENVGKSGKMVPDILFTHREVLKQVGDVFERFHLRYELELATGSTDSLEDVFALRLRIRHQESV